MATLFARRSDDSPSAGRPSTALPASARIGGGIPSKTEAIDLLGKISSPRVLRPVESGRFYREYAGAEAKQIATALRVLMADKAEATKNRFVWTDKGLNYVAVKNVDPFRGRSSPSRTTFNDTGFLVCGLGNGEYRVLATTITTQTGASLEKSQRLADSGAVEGSVGMLREDVQHRYQVGWKGKTTKENRQPFWGAGTPVGRPAGLRMDQQGAFTVPSTLGEDTLIHWLIEGDSGSVRAGSPVGTLSIGCIVAACSAQEWVGKILPYLKANGATESNPGSAFPVSILALPAPGQAASQPRAVNHAPKRRRTSPDRS